MRKADKAKSIAAILEQYFPDPIVPLDHTDNYSLLIAVLLSAQCTDIRVNQVTPFLFEKAKTPAEMLALGEENVRAIIKPCGLSPSKAKNIIGLSKILIEKHAGEVPGNIDELEMLPGVGHKTASVLMVQGFDTPAFPVDTHIFRLAHRWGLSKGKTVEKVEADLKKIFAVATWGKLHLQIILFGRTYCKARPHNPSECTICKLYGI